MIRLLRALAIGLGSVLALAALAFALLAVGARFRDGPLAMFPGGPLEAGPLIEEPVRDWGFAAGEAEIELQLLAQDRSRTVWILVDGERAFVPCSLGFPPGKSWYRTAVEDGRALLRIDGRRYPVELRRLQDAEQIARLREIAAAKYPNRPPGGGEIWVFAVASRGGPAP